MIIPRLLQGNLVTCIGKSAFLNRDDLTSVEIPNSVTRIGPCAFWWCKGLKKIIIPANTYSIGAEAFYGCKALTIYCEAAKANEEWSQNWNDGRPVIWDYKGE